MVEVARFRATVRRCGNSVSNCTGHVTAGQTLPPRPRRFLEEEFTLILSAFKNTPSSCLPLYSISISCRKYNKDSSSHRERVSEWERQRSIISCSLFPFPSCFCFLASEAVSAIFNFLLFPPFSSFSPPFCPWGELKTPDMLRRRFSIQKKGQQQYLVECQRHAHTNITQRKLLRDSGNKPLIHWNNSEESEYWMTPSMVTWIDNKYTSTRPSTCLLTSRNTLA